MTKVKTEAKAPRKAKASGKDRPVIWTEPEVKLCVGEYALTVEQAMEIMGWTNDDKKARVLGCDEPLLVDQYGNKCWATNNVHNRPFYTDNCESLQQEILNLRWRFNGEPIIVGETGLVHNGQHQLAALILADQRRQLDGDGNQWRDNWPGPCTIEKQVVYGIKEDDAVINTMDTCKPRTLMDVIFRSNLFGKTDRSSLRVLSRMLDSCVRLLWQRTGAVSDAFAPRRTNSEGMDFIQHHKRTIQAVKHVWQEYHSGIHYKEDEPTAPDKNKNWKYNNQLLGAGFAAAMLYLMGASDSDGMTYVGQDPPSERKIKWTSWEAAQDFWTEFCRHGDCLDQLFLALGYLVNPDTNQGGTQQERLALIARAWKLYKDDLPVTVKGISLDDLYSENEAGVRRLGEIPRVGGIDQGDGKGVSQPDAEELEGGGPRQPTAEDVEREWKEVRKEKVGRKKNGKARRDDREFDDSDGHLDDGPSVNDVTDTSMDDPEAEYDYVLKEYEEADVSEETPAPTSRPRPKPKAKK